jgi:hypothetical protein
VLVDSSLVPYRPSGEFVLYQDDARASQVQVRLAEGTVWLTQRLIAELFGRSVKTVNGHIRALYDEGELEPSATIRKYPVVQMEGQRRGG